MYMHALMQLKAEHAHYLLTKLRLFFLQSIQRYIRTPRRNGMWYLHYPPVVPPIIIYHGHCFAMMMFAILVLCYQCSDITRHPRLQITGTGSSKPDTPVCSPLPLHTTCVFRLFLFSTLFRVLVTPAQLLLNRCSDWHVGVGGLLVAWCNFILKNLCGSSL